MATDNEHQTQAGVLQAVRITLAWALREPTVTDVRVRVHLEDALELVDNAIARDRVVTS